jgi:Cdc6-like AAA superfamily ATPase
MNTQLIKDVLRYNPYDNKNYKIDSIKFTDNKHRKDFFYENFFVPYSETEKTDYIENIKRNLDGRFSYIIGPSGTGKTTLLHYLFEQDNNWLSKNYIIEIINLIKSPSVANEKVIIYVLEKELEECYNSEDKTFFRKFKEQILDKNLLDKTFLTDDFNHFIETACRGNMDIKIIKETIHQKCSDDEYISILLFLISFNYMFKLGFLTKIEKNKKLVIIIDNLDELPHFYIIRKLNDLLINFYSKLQDVLKENFEIEIDNVFKLLLVIRETNFALISNQLRDRLYQMTSTPLAIETNFFNKILEEREKYLFNKHKIKNEINAIIMEEEEFIQKILSPLFNFDGRMLNEALIHISTPVSIAGEDITISCITHEEYKSIKNVSHTGAHGILWLSMFKFLIDKNSKSNFKEFIIGDCIDLEKERGKCNYYRVGLTILSRLCNLPEKQGGENFENIFDSEEIFHANREEKNIRELYYLLKNIYGHSDIIKCIKNICSISSPNYETLSLCYNLVNKDDEIVNIEDYFNEKIKDLLEKIENNQQIGNYPIKINPSGYIYAYHLFRHFEYFNILNNFKKHRLYWDDKKCRKAVRPLFLPKDKKRNLDDLEKFFNEIFEITKLVINNSDKCFCKDFCKKISCNKKEISRCKTIIDKYIKNNYTINKTIYTTRVISTHLAYIDSYRKYIIEGYIYDTEFEKAHKIILDTLKNYVDLFFNKEVIDYDKFSGMEKNRGRLNEILRNANKKEYKTILSG